MAPRCSGSWKIHTKLLRISLELQDQTVHSISGLGAGIAWQYYSNVGARKIGLEEETGNMEEQETRGWF